MSDLAWRLIALGFVLGLMVTIYVSIAILEAIVRASVATLKKRRGPDDSS